MNKQEIKVKLKEGVTISSKEVAETTNKRHRDVLRDIDNMLKEIGLSTTQICALTSTYKSGTGKSYKMYNLPEDLAITLASGYNAKLRYAIALKVKELQKENHHLRSTLAQLTTTEALRQASTTINLLMQESVEGYRERQGKKPKGAHHMVENKLLKGVMGGRKIKDLTTPEDMSDRRMLETMNTAYLETDLEYQERKELLTNYYTNMCMKRLKASECTKRH